jgi:ABC-type branched-subunit amino acid transport system substrate-binding protein
VYAEGVYDPSALKRAGKRLNDLIVGTQFVPWEAPRSSPGTIAFLAAMKRAKQKPTPAAQAGWINAALLVAGIQEAGRSFTQSSVVAAINAMTDFTADGMLPGINWLAGGHGPGRERCTAYVEAVRGRFTLRFATPVQPFVCFAENPIPVNLDARTLKPASP